MLFNLGGYRLRIDGLQPLAGRRDQPDDDLIISIPNEFRWPTPRRKSSGSMVRVMTEQQVMEVTRAFQQAIAEAVAEIKDDGGLDHG